MTERSAAGRPLLDRNVMELAVENMAAQVADSQDGVIASAITAAIGEGWTLVSLTGRLVRKVYPNKVEVIAIDGKDILEFHPIRFEQVTEGGSIKIKVVQDYRVLHPNV